MADRFYGASLGVMQPKDVVEGAATGGAAAPVELRISDTAYANKLLVQQALIAIVNYLATKETTPIA